MTRHAESAEHVAVVVSGDTSMTIHAARGNHDAHWGFVQAHLRRSQVWHSWPLAESTLPFLVEAIMSVTSNSAGSGLGIARLHGDG